MTTLQTVLGFDTSDKARFRFHVLQVFYQSGWRGVKTAFPNLSRPTLYRWKKRYENSQKRLNSLVPQSTRPHRTRTMQTPLPLIALIRSLRKEHPRLGKAKIKRFVDAFCKEQNLPPLSESTIGKVIKRNKLFFAGKARGRRTRKQTNKQRIRLCPSPRDTSAGYIQVDGFKFYYIDKYYYFLTAVDIVTRQGWVVLARSINSANAASFLRHILTTSYYPVHTIQTDNGSEFEKHFRQAIAEKELIHLFSYPKHPKTNGFVERINWTVQDEFLFSFEDLLLYPQEFEKKLTGWIQWYNDTRPHQSLNYLTPHKYAQRKEDCLKST